MAAPRPGNADRGWNDPPMFSYTASKSVQSSPRRTQLNKRVAFPSSQVSKTPNVKEGLLNPDCGPPTSPVQLLPPRQLVTPSTTTVTPTPVPLLIPAMGVTCPLTSTSTLPVKSSNDVIGLQETLDRLQLNSDTDLLNHVKAVFDKQFEMYLPTLQGRAAEDIRRKLQVFKDSWTEGKLSDTVKAKISEIAEAIEAEKLEEAWSCHLLLMVDHTAEVNQWLVAVKKLIHEAKEAKCRSESEKETQVTSSRDQTENDSMFSTTAGSEGGVSLINVGEKVTNNHNCVEDSESSVDPETT